MGASARTARASMRSLAITLLLVLEVLSFGLVSAFTVYPTVQRIYNRSSLSPVKVTGYKINENKPFGYLPSNFNQNNHARYTSATSLKMGFNLPPGKKSPDDGILRGVLTIAGFALFIFSPLGSLFFAITNSILAFVLITPVILLVGFQIYQKLYLIEGTCPNCSAPVQVLKDESAAPNMCLSCGSRVRATREKDGVELCNDPSSVLQDESLGSIFESLFGGDSGSSTPFNENAEGYTSPSKNKGESKRQGTIIDVDVEED